MSKESAKTPAPVPLEIRAPEGAQLLEIAWEDGTSSLIPHRVLRGFCPCAVCQGHQGPIQWVGQVERFGPEKLHITELHQVGAYALGMSFGDGHSTGIYTFRYLEELGQVDDQGFDSLRELRFER